jgi:uncharacterized protein
MIHNFGDLTFTPAVKEAQSRMGSRDQYATYEGRDRRTRLTEEERLFIAQRDSFYMATVGENGWPYVQHRGGPPGFLEVLDDHTLRFADYRGNRQYLTVGNLSANNKVCLFLMDYVHQDRLKIWAEAEVSAGGTILPDGYEARVEHTILLHVLAFDWNCPQHITPRFTHEEIALGLPDSILRKD